MEFKKNVTAEGKTGNILKRITKKIKENLIPATKKERTKRINQIKDIGIFFGSIVAFILLEDRIQKLVSVDPNEVQKMTRAGGSMPPAF